MSYYKLGDTSSASCSNCRTIVPTTMKYEQGYTDNRLVAVCNYCGEVVAIPQQSFVKQDVNKLPKVVKKWIPIFY